MAKVEYSEDGKVLIKAYDVEGHFVVPEGVTEIGDRAFWGCDCMRSLELPDSVTKIGDEAFENCQSLTSVEMPNSVTDIGYNIFGGCDFLPGPIIINNMFVKMSDFYRGHYSIPLGISVICGGAFYRCKSLTSIEIPNSVTDIGKHAFQHCSSLASIEIPNSVTEIGDYAFEGCCSLSNIEIPESIINIPSYCFSGTKLKNIYIHKNIERIDNSAFFESPIEYYDVDADNPYYTSKDGVLMDKAETMIIIFPAGKEMESYRIPAGIQSLGNFAFIRAQFRNIDIPDTINKIGFYIFYCCNNLTEIHLRVKDPYSISIHDDIFVFFVLDQCTLYVPVGTGYAYRHHPVFGKFKEIIIER